MVRLFYLVVEKVSVENMSHFINWSKKCPLYLLVEKCPSKKRPGAKKLVSVNQVKIRVFSHCCIM